MATAAISSTPAAAAAPPPTGAQRALHRLDVGIALADGKLRDNLIKELKSKNPQALPENIEDAAQYALTAILSKPSGFFGGIPQLKKYLYDSAKASLYDRRYASNPAGRKSLRLDLDREWKRGGAVNLPAGATDSLGELLDLSTEAIKSPDGTHRQSTITGHEPGYADKEYKKRRRDEAKRLRDEEAKRTAPGAPVILSRDDRSAYEITQADMDAFAQVKARKGSRTPTVPRSTRRNGWAAKGRK